MTTEIEEQHLFSDIFGSEYQTKKAISDSLKEKSDPFKDIALRLYLMKRTNRTLEYPVTIFEKYGVEITRSSPNNGETLIFTLKDPSNELQTFKISNNPECDLAIKSYGAIGFNHGQSYTTKKFIKTFFVDPEKLSNQVLKEMNCDTETSSKVTFDSANDSSGNSGTDLSTLAKEEKDSKFLTMTPTDFYKFCYAHNRDLRKKRRYEKFRTQGFDYPVKHPFNSDFVPSELQCLYREKYDELIEKIIDKRDNELSKDSFSLGSYFTEEKSKSTDIIERWSKTNIDPTISGSERNSIDSEGIQFYPNNKDENYEYHQENDQTSIVSNGTDFEIIEHNFYKNKNNNISTTIFEESNIDNESLIKQTSKENPGEVSKQVPNILESVGKKHNLDKLPEPQPIKKKLRFDDSINISPSSEQLDDLSQSIDKEFSIFDQGSLFSETPSLDLSDHYINALVNNFF